MRATEAPTAIFATSDVVALGTLRWASIHGRSVPHELAIMGFDNIASAQHAATALSTIDNDVVELAADSVSRLMELIDAKGALPEPRANLLRGSLMVRESTGPLSSSADPERTSRLNVQADRTQPALRASPRKR